MPRPLRVLVVEDSDLYREVLRAELAMICPDLEIREAETLAAGRAVLAGWAPDVAILDVRLPDGTGLDLVTEVRARNPEACVLVCTAYDAEEYRERALGCGADRCVGKDAMGPEPLREIFGRARAEPRI
ncbi:response regulator [Deferrisoma sp.]